MSYLFHAITTDSDSIHQTDSIEQTFEELRKDPTVRASIVVENATPEEIRECAEFFDLHELAIEDIQVGHQRPKLERYGDALFVVLHEVKYADKTEKMSFSELHIFVGKRFFLVFTTSRRLGQNVVHWIHRSYRRDVLDPGDPQALLYFVFDGVTDGYLPIIIDLEDDLDEIEDSLFGEGMTSESSQRIYELFNEVVKFQRVTRPLTYMIDMLTRGAIKYGMDVELTRYLRDVKDNLTHAVEQLDGLRAALQNALTVEATLVGQKQNEDMKKVSGWAAIFAVSTVIAGIYGMNFENMPELEWGFGYLWAIGLMLTASVILYLVFRKNKWM